RKFRLKSRRRPTSHVYRAAPPCKTEGGFTGEKLISELPKEEENNSAAANRTNVSVVTFDHYGVTGHSNHVSIFDALLYFFEDPAETGLKVDFRVYMLESVNILRKYSGLLDGACSYLWPSTYVYLLTPDQRRKLDLAMSQHGSQLAWLRRLYCRFSRYMYVNTLNELTEEKAETDKNE
ncbi:N-acetylglucosaminyl-phosphatidylinositol de-N-acetylase-like, partial [Tropilaelaps mercedesae]